MDVRVLEKPDLAALRAIPGARTDYVRAINWTLDHIAQSDPKRRARISDQRSPTSGSAADAASRLAIQRASNRGPRAARR